MNVQNKKFSKKGVAGKLLASCFEATELISVSKDRPLTKTENFQLQMHLFVCKGCRGFLKNSDTLSDMMKQHKQREMTLSKEQLSKQQWTPVNQTKNPDL